MIIQCPRCQTKYELDESILPPGGSTVRCTRCGHVFQASPPTDAGEIGDDLLDFLGEGDDGFLADGEDKKKGRAGKIILWIVLILIILGLMGLGTVVLLKSKGVHLDKDYLKIDLFEKAPFLNIFGSSGKSDKAKAGQEKPDHGNAEIELEGVTGRFADSAQAGQVFIVQGSVRNAYAEPVSFIRLKGFLHTKTARNAVEKIAYAGNILTETELANFSGEMMDAALLNKAGSGNANLNVPPDESVKFMIVFYNLPKNLTEYTVEVVSSQKAGSG